MVGILIVIPYWQGDQVTAKEMCRVIAGLQANHAGTTAHVMLVARQDVKMDHDMINIISKKFNTLTHLSASPLRGWPNGSNGIFGDSMIRISNSKFDKTYETVFWMEPDCVPMRPNWFWDLVIAWRGRHPTTKIVGCRHDCNGDGTGDHITGCAMYHPNIARILPQICKSDHIAWDYQHRAAIVRMGGPTNQIANRYKGRNVEPTILNDPAAVIHGIKDYSLIKLVAKKYGIQLAV